MKKNRALSILIVVSLSVCGQDQYQSQGHVFADYTGAIGSSQGTVAGTAGYNRQIGKGRRIEIGLGVRGTAYFGTKKDFLTAGPAHKTRTYTTPFLIFFAGQEEQNFDTLTVQRPFTNSWNLMVHLGYNLSRKWYAGFNIDLIGFTIGRKGSGILTSNGVTGTDPDAKPSSFNLLLTGDHDKGTLNSEFLLKYRFNEKWALKAVYQFIFVEYQTPNRKQFFSDGTTNGRFRNKANNVGLGITFHFIK